MVFAGKLWLGGIGRFEVVGSRVIVAVVELVSCIKGWSLAVSVMV